MLTPVLEDIRGALKSRNDAYCCGFGGSGFESKENRSSIAEVPAADEVDC